MQRQVAVKMEQCVILLACILSLSQATIWRQTPGDVRACHGDDASLFWKFTLEAGEDPQVIRWYKGPTSNREQIATYLRPNGPFTPNTPYTHLDLSYDDSMHTTDATLVILGADSSDAGQYSVTLQPVADNSNARLIVGPEDMGDCTISVNGEDCTTEVIETMQGTISPNHFSLTCDNLDADVEVEATLSDGVNWYSCININSSCDFPYEVNVTAQLEATVTFAWESIVCDQKNLTCNVRAPSTTVASVTSAPTTTDVTSNPSDSAWKNIYILPIVIGVIFLAAIIGFAVALWRSSRGKVEGGEPNSGTSEDYYSGNQPWHGGYGNQLWPNSSPWVYGQPIRNATTNVTSVPVRASNAIMGGPAYQGYFDDTGFGGTHVASVYSPGN